MRLALLALVSGCSFLGRGEGDVPIDAAATVIDAVAIDVMPAPARCFSVWCSRKLVTIDGGQVTGGPHAQFPVLIDLPVDTDLANGARDDGFDIVFTAGDGATKLAYERAIFDGTTGRLVAWVSVPVVASGADTTIYMYWGNVVVTSDQQNVEGTWDATTEAVWHLDTGEVRDSTVNANHGTGSGGVVLGTDAKIGGGATFDGSNDLIRIPESSSLDSTTVAGTLAAWVNWTDAMDGGFQSILTSANTFTDAGDGYLWAVQSDGDLYFYPWHGNLANYNLAVPGFTNGAWHHVAVTFDAQTRDVSLFVDGVGLTLAMTNTPVTWTTFAQPTQWLWGGNPDRPTEFFRGSLDELRVARSVRSAGWLATEFRNQRSPGTFSTLGPVELLTP